MKMLSYELEVYETGKVFAGEVVRPYNYRTAVKEICGRLLPPGSGGRMWVRGVCARWTGSDEAEVLVYHSSRKKRIFVERRV